MNFSTVRYQKFSKSAKSLKQDWSFSFGNRQKTLQIQKYKKEMKNTYEKAIELAKFGDRNVELLRARFEIRYLKR